MDLGLVAIAFLAISSWQTRELLGAETPAPDFVLRDLRGGEHSLSALRGKKVVLAFWAPWCGVCKSEAGVITELARSLAGDVAVVAIALDYGEVAEVERFVRENGLDVPVLLGDREVARRYAVSAFPTIYVIDREGRVEHSVVGYTTEVGLRARLL